MTERCTKTLSAEEVRSQILRAARAEVLSRGVLGMRVARVAVASGVPIATMYRLFGGRDALLAQVMLQLYEETFEAQFSVVQLHLGGTGPLTVSDIVASLPQPKSEMSSREHSVRSQVLAIASVNAELRRLLSESLVQRRRMLETIFDDVDARLPKGIRIDREVFRVLVFNLSWTYNDLMAEEAIDNARYQTLMHRLAVTHDVDFSAR